MDFTPPTWAADRSTTSSVSRAKCNRRAASVRPARSIVDRKEPIRRTAMFDGRWVLFCREPANQTPCGSAPRPRRSVAARSPGVSHRGNRLGAGRRFPPPIFLDGITVHRHSTEAPQANASNATATTTSTAEHTHLNANNPSLTSFSRSCCRQISSLVFSVRLAVWANSRVVVARSPSLSVHPENRALFAAQVLPDLRSAVADLSWLVGRGFALVVEVGGRSIWP